MRQGRKNGKIDFLKFFFALVIVIHHGVQKVLSAKYPQFIGGSLAVEFFFIVSGYLLMASIQRLPARTQPLGVETGRFMWRKIKSFYPEVALCFVLGFAVEFFAQKDGLLLFWEKTFQNLFLLNMTGIGVASTHGELWYISSMLICMMILFPLLRKYPDMMTRVVCPLLALLLLGYFCMNKTSPRSPTTVWKEFTYKGNIRALAELSIGVCLYPLAEKLKAVKLSTFSRILVSIVEWGCYIAIFEYMRLKTASRLDYYYIAMFALAILLSFSGQGVDTKLFQNRFCAFLGKLSFPVYLAHNAWAKNINEFLPKGYSEKRAFVIYLALATVTTVVIYLLSGWLRKLGKVLQNPARKLFLAKEE